MKTLLYIDGENLQYSLRKRYGLDLEPSTLLALAQTVGVIQSARLYADFAAFPRTVTATVYAVGIELIHVPGYPSGNGDGRLKSTTDQRLELDCLERILTGAPVEAVIVAAGDRGYVHLLEKLRQKGLRRIILAVEQTTSWWLKATAEQFLAYPVPEDSRIEAPSVPDEEPPCSSEPRPLADEDHRILLDTLRSSSTPMSYVPLIKSLQKQKRTGTLTLSNRQLKQLLHEAMARGTVVREERGGLAYYRLAEQKDRLTQCIIDAGNGSRSIPEEKRTSGSAKVW